MIQNKSNNKLPKDLFLRKTSLDDVQFVEIHDTDALSPWFSKKVSLPLLLPDKKGTYLCMFSYFNRSNKKMGGDLIVRVICQ
mmetsp:Transcript_13623/g.15807  ORF Transcript_13623/g.15807 Transcript_13623/m.15807 type:complete len:82 (-) Transcript_13623:46-291(-)